LLSATIIFAIAMPASAVDVKFSGMYHVWGVFDKNHSLLDGEAYQNWGFGGAMRNGNVAGSLMAGYAALGTTYEAIPAALDHTGSQAFFQQRLRIQTDIKVVEGLTLVTRFDALEKKWGDRRWAGGPIGSASVDSASRNEGGTAGVAVKTQENIEFERAYVDFNTGIGKFMVGYQNFIAFGTLFGDSFATRPGIKYIVPVGPVTIIAAWEKANENNSGRPTSAGGGFQTDADSDIYDLGFVYKGKAVEAGAIWQYSRNASNRPDAAGLVPGIGTVSNLHVIDPYVKATFGPVYLEAEVAYVFGKQQFDDLLRANTAVSTALGVPVTMTDVDVEGMGLYLGARVDLQPVYFGLQFAWIRGDDPATPDKKEGSLMEGMIAGQAYNPALMMFNDDFVTWVGDRASGTYRGALPTNKVSAFYPSTAASAKYSMDTFMDNVWFYHAYVGVKPVPKADIKLAFSYAYADKKPWVQPPTPGISTIAGAPNMGNPASEFNSNKYGYELDLTASYKIYDNLEYMVGVGYFWPGDYFKGCYNSTQAGCYNFEPALANDYLLMHKLTLSF